MCGLAAAFRTDVNSQIVKDNVRKMQKELYLRGPDASGEMFTPDVGLVHQRLSIMDVESAPQPYNDEKMGLSLVYNGEIYNFKILREELKKAGFSFNTDCDTEVVFKGFMHWGEGVFEKLDGMFAIVIVNHRSGDVFVGRDRFGIKPLYVYDSSKGVRVFASNINAIEAFGDGAISHSVSGVDQYMRLGFYLEPDTHLSGVRQVVPGTYEVHKLRSPNFSSFVYWDAGDRINSSASFISNDDGVNLLEKAIDSQRQADVPLGSFLSGGLDSSLTTSILCSQEENKKIKTFSAGFNNSDFDEVPLAAQLSSHLGAEHHAVYFDDTLMRNAKLITDIYGAPFADNAALPTHYLSREAKKHVKVLLSGDGADEMFFGYSNHRSMMNELRFKEKMPDWLRRDLLGWVAGWYPNHPKMPRVTRARATLESLSTTLASGYCSAMSITSRRVLNEIYHPEFKKLLGENTAESKFEEHARNFDHDDPMKLIQYLDFKTYLPGSVLTKADRATMAASVEARVPFLSNDLVDTVLPQATRLNLNGSGNKQQLRAWSKHWLPSENQKRAKKSFTSPLDYWFRQLQSEQICDMILTESFCDQKVFNVDALKKKIHDHVSGNIDLGPTLWALSIYSASLE